MPAHPIQTYFHLVSYGKGVGKDEANFRGQATGRGGVKLAIAILLVLATFAILEWQIIGLAAQQRKLKCTYTTQGKATDYERYTCLGK